MSRGHVETSFEFELNGWADSVWDMRDRYRLNLDTPLGSEISQTEVHNSNSFSHFTFSHFSFHFKHIIDEAFLSMALASSWRMRLQIMSLGGLLGNDFHSFLGLMVSIIDRNVILFLIRFGRI